MLRVSLALLIAPLIVSSIYGVIGLVIVLPVMLLVTGVLAIPLLFVFRRRGWLRWWHAGLVGFVCGVIFLSLFALTVSPGWVDAYGLQSAMSFGGVGVATALLFWWLGLYRNRAFPEVPTSIPYGMLSVVPLAVVGFIVYRSLDPTPLQGRIVSVSGEAPTRQTSVRLSSGSIVEVPFTGDDRPASVLINQCWHLSKHWSTTRFRKVYSLQSPFGFDGTNEC